ncbi:MAG: hypothetical protein HYT80_07795 [Euryarchaeota archaeon]|nr:hypothetical protein [Euryarchaeota archaeon]
MKRITVTKEEALEYHHRHPHGKIEVQPTKPTQTQRDLALAYTPGVAEPCREIERDPELAYRYTTKDNLVGVVTNGTAVLGLGNIGPLAGKPVMEGKGILFKKFADINVFDIEVSENDPKKLVEIVKSLEPTFGGINLEDIKAPECFYVEEQLKKTMKIPVFHDDQHGTAIITSAALMNALEVAKKKPESVKVVISGAGAAGIASANLYVKLGVKREHVTLVDTAGVVHKGRKENMNPYKDAFAHETKARTLADAMKGADVFMGLSAPNIVSPDMIRSMARDPIVFALANPDPEIKYDDAVAARPDVIMATGRSDFPNQVNNVLGFPFIFRGALDTRATEINDEMKLAAARALAKLAREDVPDSVLGAYHVDTLRFGREYLIPKPLDPRVLLWVTPAVAEAAMKTGVARKPVDLAKYKEELEARLGKQYEMMRVILNKAKRNPKRIVFAEGMHDKVLRACQVIFDEKIAVGRGLHGARRPVHPRPRGEARTQGRHPAGGAGAPSQPQLLREHDGRGGRRGRLHQRRRLPLPGRAAAGPPGHRDPAGRPQGRGLLHAELRGPRPLPRGRDRQHRAHRRGPCRDCDRGRPRRPQVRGRAPRRHAELQQLRLEQPPGRDEGRAGRPARQGTRARSHGRRRDAGRHGDRPRDPPDDVQLLEPQGARERPRVPAPRSREHGLQAPPAACERDDRRPHP